MQKYSINKAINRLNISRGTLYKYIKKCKLKTVKKQNKTYLSLIQIEKIETEIQKNSIKKPIEDKTVYTLKTKIKTQKNIIQEMEKKIDTLKIKNIEFQTKSKILEQQNNKIIFQLGAVAEKITMLEREKAREIEIKTETSKQGIFKKSWNYIRNRL